MSPPKPEPGGRLAKILTICFSILTLVVLFHLIGSLISPRNPSTSSALAPCDKTACQSLVGISTLPSTECKCPLTEAANPGLETKLAELLQISKANEVKLDTKVAQVLQAVQSVPAVGQSAPAVAGNAELVDRYLTLMANTLTGIVYRRPPFASRGGTKDVPLVRVPFDEAAAAVGIVWPDVGHTMVGLRRLENIRTLLEAVMKDNIPGDFLEAGVWRGGSCIFARAVLDVYKSRRLVHVCDSFEGLPPTSNAKDDDSWSKVEFLRVSKEEVQQHFKSYNLLNERVLFHKGFFRDSLPSVPVAQLAVIRADGDMYESTMDILFNLYGKLSVGGYVIIDDWGIPVAQEAVFDFARWHDFLDDVNNRVVIDVSGIYWKKTKVVNVNMTLYGDFNSKRTPGKATYLGTWISVLQFRAPNCSPKKLHWLSPMHEVKGARSFARRALKEPLPYGVLQRK